ncbi:MAG: DinB family protein [Lacibacter sp.]|jgi:hypothetical protein
MPVKDYHLHKFQILSSQESILDEIFRTANSVSEEAFFKGNRLWSIAENMEHLRISFHKSWQLIFIPKFILKWKFGKPVHASLPYEQLEQVYRQKLAAGARAQGVYVPQLKPGQYTKAQLMERLRKSSNRYLDEIRYYWEDEHIDQYQIPHPILGTITARELMYFNIFHCWIHFNAIRRQKESAY